MNNLANKILKDDFTQVVVWESTSVPEGKEAEFENFILEDFGIECQYLECVITNPGFGGPGCRSDLMFAIKDASENGFCTKRLQFGMRYIEDIYSDINGRKGDVLYPSRIKEYMSWNPDYTDSEWARMQPLLDREELYNLMLGQYKRGFMLDDNISEDKANRLANIACIKTVNDAYNKQIEERK